jgi:putative tryptophan/tyrosine transport system substrate-binding protein
VPHPRESGGATGSLASWLPRPRRAAPVIATAQPAGKVYRIGFLGGASAAGYAALVNSLRLGLQDHGYVEGKNITIEYRWAEGKYDRLPTLAAELVRLHPDIIITQGTPDQIIE